jgi:hypothetical protein
MRFGERIFSIIRVKRIIELLVANVSGLLILLTMMTEAVLSSETPVLTEPHG